MTSKLKPIKRYEPVDLKLGIKSSLPRVKSTLALVIVLKQIIKDSDEIYYSEEIDNKIVLAKEYREKIYEYFKDLCLEKSISKEELIEKINENQLFNSQIESLIVALELIWKLGKIFFVDDTKSFSAERTGKARYEKRICYSLNIDIVESVLIGNIDEYKGILFAWLGFNYDYKDKYELALEKTLLAFSEMAIYKKNTKDESLLFNNNSMYESLSGKNQKTSIDGDHEAKGSLRILKTSLKENLNPYIEYNNDGTVSRKNKLKNYQKRVDTYLSLLRNDILSDEISSQEDEYEQAARFAEKYVQKHHINIYKKVDSYTKFRDDFYEKYGPDKLKAIKDSDLLEKMFYTSAKTNDSLCYWLERKDTNWGSIFGGSVYKFKVNQKDKTRQWYVDGKKTDEATALKKGKEIRDMLVQGSQLIENSELNCIKDYTVLNKKMKKILGKYHEINWIHKYFSVLYPKKLSGYHTKEWQEFILKCFLIHPSDKYYVRSGQIALISKYCDWEYPNLWEMTAKKFGEKPCSFYQLNTEYDNQNYYSDLNKNQYVGIGWTKELGDLSELYKNDSDYKVNKIKNKLLKEDKELAGQMTSFYHNNTEIVFVFDEDGIASSLADDIGDYYYIESAKVGHRKKAKYHNCFSGEKLIDEDDGKDYVCREIKNDINQMFLFKRYYYEKDEFENRNGFYEWEKNYTDQSDKTNQDYVDYLNSLKINEDRFEQTIFAETNIRRLQSKQRELRRQDRTKQKKASALEKYIEYLKERGANEMIDLKFDSKLKIDKKRNRIVFGAPGTGKSTLVDEECEYMIKEYGAEFERVTFHPDYTYSQFVGTYKPYMEGDDIQYRFVPGPFMRVLSKAYQNILSEEKTKPFILIIEEINRANVAAVFGDVFQLLDRNKKGISDFSIEASEDIKNYLSMVFDADSNSFDKIRIPNNMFIWSTMNSADQGVFPMDTAFKRRWDFEYLDINHNEEKLVPFRVSINGYKKKIEWNDLRKEINNRLTMIGINEDKLLGTFFIKKEDKDSFNKVFKEKVLMYLFEDAAKQKRKDIFNTDIFGQEQMLFSKICSYYDTHGIDALHPAISEKFSRFK